VALPPLAGSHADKGVDDIRCRYPRSSPATTPDSTISLPRGDVEPNQVAQDDVRIWLVESRGGPINYSDAGWVDLVLSVVITTSLGTNNPI
jgi:hypothetical protein